MTINLNTNPWYDDYDESKNFLKILFKPSYAVQARELTQLQTALQAQISRFGNHIFKDGSIVLNGNTTQTDVYWIDIDTANSDDVSLLVNVTFTGSTSGAIGRTFLTKNVSDSITRLYYTSITSETFLQGEDFTIPSGDIYQVAGADLEETFWGTAKAYSINESVFYVKGYFVYCEPQTIILYEDSDVTDLMVGLQISEDVITYLDDQTLLDPAQGSYNYAAPGADRYTISLDLVKYEFDPQDQVLSPTADFIELSRFVDNKLVFNITSAQYADLETTLARRTYDESGDYTVQSFGIKVKDYIFPDEYELDEDTGEETDVLVSDNKLTVAIEPGKAYVKGYEFETIATQNIGLNKAKTVIEKNDRVSQVDFGDYFFVTTPSGASFDYNSNTEVNIKNASDTIIGTAIIRAISKDTADKFKLFVYNVSFNDSSYTVTDINKFVSGSWVAMEWYTEKGDTPVFHRSERKAFIAPLSDSYIEEGTTSNPTVINVGYQKYVRIDTLTVDSTGLISDITVPGTGIQFYSTIEEDYYLVSSGDEVTITTVTPDDDTLTIQTSGAAQGTVCTLYCPVRVTLETASVSKTKTLETSTTEASFAYDAVSGDADYPKREISLGIADCYKLIQGIAYDSANYSVTYLGEADSDPTDLENPADGDTYVYDGVLYYYDGTSESWLNEAVGIVITSSFDFYTGQTDELYDWGSVELSSGYDADNFYDATNGYEYDTFLLEFSYFAHAGSSSFFSVDSYTDSGVDYVDIPTYTSTIGELYNLRDCLDFRLYKNISGVISGASLVEESLVECDYSYYIPRIDKLVITKERKFYIIEGIPAEEPEIPSDMPDAMTLYIMYIPPYTGKPEDVTYTYIDNRRYTMRDIGKLEKRIERVEYYTTLSYLEKQASDETYYDDGGVERFKNGILVDSFAGHSVGDVNNVDYSCSIDPENRIMRPRFCPYGYEYYIPTTSTSNYITNLTKKKDLIYLPYTSEVLYEQPYATNYVNLNPYMIFLWNGTMELNPATDTWVDTQTRPDVVINLNGENDVYTSLVDNVQNPASVGVRWNDWQTVNRGVSVTDNISTNTSTSTSSVTGRVLQTTTSTTTNNQTTTVTDTLARTGIEISTSAVSTVTRDLGTRVVDTSIIPYCRERIVHFAAENLKPKTDLSAIFDGVDVSDYCHPTLEVFIETYSTDATKVRISSGVKEADVVMAKEDRIFVVMGDGFYDFEVDESLQWYVGGTWITSTKRVTAVNDYVALTTNENGDVAGIFHLPNNDLVRFKTGERVFRLADAPGDGASTAAETKYVASGMSQSVERTIVATRVATVSINPVSQTTTKSTSSTKSIVLSTSTKTVDITPPPPTPPLADCGKTKTGRGSTGKQQFTLNFGTNVGDCGVEYNAWSVPDRYTITWNGKTYTSGFRGSSSYNKRLNAMGYPNVAGSGSGYLKFVKTSAYPTTAILTVDAPFSGTGWNFKPVCPTTASNKVSYKLSITTASSINMDVGDNTARTAVTLKVSGGLSSGFYGKVSLGAVKSNPGFNYYATRTSKTPITSTIIKNGSSKTIYVELNRSSASLSRWASFSTTLSCSVAEYSSAACSSNTRTATSTASARKSQTWRVTDNSSDDNGWDPIAQTFFISADKYPNGLFVNKLSLFFRKKSTTVPVQVQLRPVVNGYPSSDVILPFGTAAKHPNQVVVSTDGSKATTFTFQNIVHLAPGEYCFVAMSTTDEYEIFTAKLGEFSLQDETQRITTQPSLGSMFKSQNARTWTAAQDEDVKFIIHKCVFDTASSGTVTFLTNVSKTRLSPEDEVLPESANFDVFYTMGETVDFAATKIAYAYSTEGESFKSYQLGSNVTMDTTKTLEADEDLRFRATLSTTDSNVTPIVDANRMSSNLIKNIINDNPTDEDAAYGGSSQARYITRRVKLNSGFEATDLVVQFMANIPSTCSVKVYYKVSSVTDLYFDDNEYVEMIKDTSTSVSETTYSEYKYITENNQCLDGGAQFDTFAIKIVMLLGDGTGLGTSGFADESELLDSTRIPQIKDLRVIALDA